MGRRKKFIRPIFLRFNSWANVWLCLFVVCMCAREKERRLKLDLTSEINSMCARVRPLWRKKSHPWLTNSFTLLFLSLLLPFPVPSYHFFPFHPIDGCGLFLLYPCCCCQTVKKKQTNQRFTSHKQKQQENRHKTHTLGVFCVQLVKQAKLLQLENRFFRLVCTRPRFCWQKFSYTLK